MVARKTVLIVEDDADVGEALAELLEDAGYAAVIMGNGIEGLDCLKREPTPALILLDALMPVMDGGQFRAAQIEDPDLAGIPTVVLTAQTRHDALANLEVTSGILWKPVQMDDLLATVRRWCDGEMLRPA